MGEIVLDPPRDEHLKEFAPEGFALQIETIARQLLSDSARALAHMAGDEVFECGANDAEDVVTVVLIKFVVLGRDDGVDEIGGSWS